MDRTRIVPALLRRLLGLFTWARLLVLVLAGVAAGLGAWSLTTEGLETYYAAGVRSMAADWHNFFYGAFDLRGTMTLDKLPGALWVQALSVRAFGYSVWAMVLPQVVETGLTVLVLYRAVRRIAGTAAGLIAAALFAVTPVVVSSTRGNLPEPLYLLCLVLAADAVLRAVTRNRRRSVLMAAFWIAVAFQAKMAEAWLVLPALAVALLVGLRPGERSDPGSDPGSEPASDPRPGRRRGLLWTGVLGLLATGLSLVWVVAVTLTPAASRPVVDGSTHNSEFEQVFLYNGVSRFDDNDLFGLAPLATPTAHAREAAQQRADDPGYQEAGLTSYGSSPSWHRLFVGLLAPDCAWLWPLTVAGAALLLRRRPASWRRLRKQSGRRPDPVRAAAWLWVVWLGTYGAVFSASHLMHDYYVSVLIPPLAALAGTGLARLWSAARIGGRRATWLLGSALVVEAGWCAALLAGHGEAAAGAAVGVVGAAAGAGAVVLFRSGAVRSGQGGRSRLRVTGGVVTATAMGLALVAGPVVADVWLLERSGGAFDTPLAATGTLVRPTPAAAAARGRIRGYGGGVQASFTAARWQLLLARGRVYHDAESRRHTRILVFASSVAAGYVMGGVAELEPVGGFTGDVPFPTVDTIGSEMHAGQISFAVVPDKNMLLGADPRVQLVEAVCRPLTDDGAVAVYDCR
ncbi:ArnT family glycosyltransferase [Streptacidiphilus jiangxiensis]|uniref:4-amino-4-deoxy-L-arabinose transferase n=1 Tax=Streptacidiphilus jiangxiensis TaxID=235985 RepID=A0A1H7V1S4_STRJI|nr:glycosyltransferase family 39 protein [Streptacidiphilus jiangxiensis]SEM02989.1 4-amino-4-deoxy-L-arabinose transferase [Streptacidiphilus jiangxiensis]